MLPPHFFEPPYRDLVRYSLDFRVVLIRSCCGGGEAPAQRSEVCIAAALQWAMRTLIADLRGRNEAASNGNPQPTRREST